MNKILSVLSLAGFIISSIKADATSQQKTQVASDTPPQTAFVPAAATYQNADTLSLLNNPTYDSTLYQSFVPQDAVQQYVSQYNGGFSNGQVMEGFIVPVQNHHEYAPIAPTFISFLKTFLPGPKFLFAIAAKVVALAASALGIVFFGGAITSFICAFTPLCTITFIGRPLAFLSKETKEIGEKIAAEITTEKVKRAADLFKLAYDKYSQMN